MSVIKEQDLDFDLYKKINELEKRIKQNENKKKLINYNEIKYFMFNNKYIIINLFLLYINLYLLYLNFFNQDKDSFNIYDNDNDNDNDMVIYIDKYNKIINNEIGQAKILGSCHYKGLIYFMWQNTKN